MNRGSLSANDGMPTVCFVARGDFESRPGGDTMQWRVYERVAREAGLRAIAWFDNYVHAARGRLPCVQCRPTPRTLSEAC